MKLRLKLLSLLTLLLFASTVILLKGCGSKGGVTGGGPSGLCPDSVAPSGSKVVVPTGLPAPFIGHQSCYPGLGFTVTDSSGNPLNGICVVITSNADIALATVGETPACNNADIAPQTQIVTRTDASGNVIVDMLTSAATASGNSYFVEVSSGALSNVATTAKAGS